jgi:hypothetical protein
MGKVYHKKLCTSGFKVIYFILIVSFGYYVQYELPFFPKSLGGSGEIANMFDDGYPGFYFWKKSDLFDLYYMVNLTYHAIDLVWLVFIYELQTDYVMMILHHVCTISLVTFSYMSNHSNIGCIIMFLHDFSDIFVYFTRSFINTDISKIAKIVSGVSLLGVFVYTRVYVFGQAIYTISANYSRLDCWNYMNCPLVTFLTFLYIMHLYWVYSILKKIGDGIFANKIEDTYKVKKVR